MTGIPVIEIRLQDMKHAFLTMLSEHELKLEAAVTHAIDAYCTPANLQRVLDEQVKTAIDQAVKETVTAFYSYGAGRKYVRGMVEDFLKRQQEIDE